MLEQFKEFINSNGLFTHHNRILIAVSGGVDSMVMLDLLNRCGYKIGIAHCNFNLRGNESDKDAEFVRKMASEYKTSYYYKSFDTLKFAESNGLSVQMAARDLRYEWFEEIRKKEGFDFISTGHNLDDNVETFFVNLLRGTGLTGLTGIPLKSGNVVRPVLFASRNEIQKYASEKGIHFRTDSSNEETKYLRNKIRHEIIPLFKSMQSEFNVLMNETMQRLGQMNGLYMEYVNSLRSDLLKKEEERFIIRINSIIDLNYPETVLFELLKPFGFNSGMVNDLLSVMKNGIPGKQFKSSSHILTMDRDYLLIDPKTNSQKDKYIITRCKTEINDPICLDFNVKKISEFEFNKDPDYACLDYDKLEFPLSLKRWQKGDVFYPLGMKQPKKLSDFFIDQKIPLPDKAKIWLLCSGNDIVWIVGHRIDERYKISSSTQKVFVIQLKA